MSKIPPKIEMCESFTIDEYSDIAREFLDKIFDLDLDSTFISDESMLYDFAGCCYPETQSPLGKINDFYALATQNMIRIIKAEYNIDVVSHDYLITVFEQIRKHRDITVN